MCWLCRLPSLLGHSPFLELPPPSPCGLEGPLLVGQSSQLSSTWRSTYSCSHIFSGAHPLQ